MATVDIVSSANQKTGSVDLDAEIFEAVVKPHLFHAEVRRQLALRHTGTHSTKNRAMVSGGGAKPYRQKGTGRARQGTTRAPQFAGGGVVFGPVPRSYDHKLTKKARRAALRGALSLRLKEESLTVIDGIELDEYKTKKVVEVLSALELAGQSVLIVIGDEHEKLERSARNIKGVGVIRAGGLNVYDLLRHKQLVLTKDALDQLEARLGAASASAGAEA